MKSNPIEMGEHAAFERMFRTYHKALCYYVGHIVADQAAAEDIVSEVFMQCWKQHRTFDGEDHARFYLYRAANHAALNHLKLNQRATQKHERAGRTYADAEESHQERYIRSEVLRNIYTEIDALPTQERTVLLLTLKEGRKLQEIADELGLSLQTVKNCKSRAIRRLRTKLSVENFLALLVAITPL